MDRLFCPDCEKSLPIKSRRCTCGWVKADISKVSNEIVDKRCIYKHSSMQCPYLASISSSTHANATWYCLGHFQNLNNTEKCIEILIQAEMNFIAVMEERIHWSVKLIPEEYVKAKKKINDMYLELFRK